MVLDFYPTCSETTCSVNHLNHQTEKSDNLSHEKSRINEEKDLNNNCKNQSNLNQGLKHENSSISSSSVSSMPSTPNHSGNYLKNNAESAVNQFDTKVIFNLKK